MKGQSVHTYIHAAHMHPCTVQPILYAGTMQLPAETLCHSFFTVNALLSVVAHSTSQGKRSTRSSLSFRKLYFLDNAEG